MREMKREVDERAGKNTNLCKSIHFVLQFEKKQKKKKRRKNKRSSDIERYKEKSFFTSSLRLTSHTEKGEEGDQN